MPLPAWSLGPRALRGQGTERRGDGAERGEGPTQAQGTQGILPVGYLGGERETLRSPGLPRHRS